MINAVENNSDKKLLSEWNILSDQLTMLKPASLSGKQIAACHNYDSSQEFLTMTPFVLAVFRKSAHDEIYKFAIQQPSPTSVPIKEKSSLEKDIGIISEFLFQAEIYQFSSVAGLHTKERVDGTTACRWGDKLWTVDCSYIPTFCLAHTPNC